MTSGERKAVRGEHYAAVRNGFVIALAVADNDSTAQSWFAQLAWRNRERARLVVLDLAANETAELGQRVHVDADGVATICRLEAS